MAKKPLPSWLKGILVGLTLLGSLYGITIPTQPVLPSEYYLSI